MSRLEPTRLLMPDHVPMLRPILGACGSLRQRGRQTDASWLAFGCISLYPAQQHTGPPEAPARNNYHSQRGRSSGACLRIVDVCALLDELSAHRRRDLCDASITLRQPTGVRGPQHGREGATYGAWAAPLPGQTA